jgi:predicted methyltransferase
MMKAPLWAVAAAMVLLLPGAGVYAEDIESAGKAPADGNIFPVTPKNLQSVQAKKEQRLKAIEAKKAEEEEKQREKEKKAKIDKIQRKTGRTAVSWQVQNR